MSAVFDFKPTPLSLALTAQAVTLLLLAVPNAHAQVVVTQPGAVISSTTPQA